MSALSLDNKSALMVAYRTRHRQLTFYDGSTETPFKDVCYCAMAQPFCAQLREVTAVCQYTRLI